MKKTMYHRRQTRRQAQLTRLLFWNWRHSDSISAMAKDSCPSVSEETHRQIILTDPTGNDEHLRAWQDIETGVITIRANLHLHTHYSDGAASPEDLKEWAEKHWMNFAHTDHNSPGSFWHPNDPDRNMYVGEIAGIEVNTKEGVDVVVIGSRSSIVNLFMHHMHGIDFNQHGWKYAKTGMTIAELIEAARALNCRVIHPHYSTIDGLSTIPVEKQHEHLTASKDIGFVESNGQRHRWENTQAEAIAAAYDMPFLRTGDTHVSENQYTHFYTEFTLPDTESIARTNQTPILTVLDTARTGDISRSEYEQSVMGKLRTAAQIMSQIPWKLQRSYAWRALMRAARHPHAGAAFSLLAHKQKEDVISELQLRAVPQTEGVACAVDS